jgi:hypothetical protein
VKPTGGEVLRGLHASPAADARARETVAGRGLLPSDSRSHSSVASYLLAVAAIVTASVRRFESVYLYFVAAAVVVGLCVVAAIMLAP